MKAVARAINEDLKSNSSMRVGATLVHPSTGRLVKVVSGKYYGSFGRVSNWWTWREVKPDGRLGAFESGYGW